MKITPEQLAAMAKDTKKMEGYCDKVAEGTFEDMIARIRALDIKEHSVAEGVGIGTVTRMYSSVLMNLLEAKDYPNREAALKLAAGLFATMVVEPLKQVLEMTGAGGIVEIQGD